MPEEPKKPFRPASNKDAPYQEPIKPIRFDMPAKRPDHYPPPPVTDTSRKK